MSSKRDSGDRADKRYSTVRARREVSPTDGATAAKPRTGGRFYKDGYLDKDRQKDSTRDTLTKDKKEFTRTDDKKYVTESYREKNQDKAQRGGKSDKGWGSAWSSKSDKAPRSEKSSEGRPEKPYAKSYGKNDKPYGREETTREKSYGKELRKGEKPYGRENRKSDKLSEKDDRKDGKSHTRSERKSDKTYGRDDKKSESYGRGKSSGRESRSYGRDEGSYIYDQDDCSYDDGSRERDDKNYQRSQRDDRPYKREEKSYVGGKSYDRDERSQKRDDRSHSRDDRSYGRQQGYSQEDRSYQRESYDRDDQSYKSESVRHQDDKKPERYSYKTDRYSDRRDKRDKYHERSNDYEVEYSRSSSGRYSDRYDDYEYQSKSYDHDDSNSSHAYTEKYREESQSKNSRTDSQFKASSRVDSQFKSSGHTEKRERKDSDQTSDKPERDSKRYTTEKYNREKTRSVRDSDDYTSNKKKSELSKNRSSREKKEDSQVDDEEAKRIKRHEERKREKIRKQEEEEQKQKELEEKKRIEEEEQERERIEQEERKEREEEERLRKEEEDRLKLIEEEKKALNDFICEQTEKLSSKEKMRASNKADKRPEEAFFSKLDSSLKKNSAFVKKMKNITEGQRDSLAKEMQGLNLSKYVSEVATAITESKFKMSDIPCYIHLCSLLHQRYADFSPALLENWVKILPNKKDDKIMNPSKLRVDLRLFAELITVGVFTAKVGLPVLASQLTHLLANDKEEHNNLGIIISFCKHCGNDYAGLIPRKYRLLAEKYEHEIPQSLFLPAERQKACRNLFKEYFTSLGKHILKDFRHLKDMERSNKKQLRMKGDLSAERKERYDNALQVYQKLMVNANIYSDLLDDDLPELPDDEPAEDLEASILEMFDGGDHPFDENQALFEDEDTRRFYETIPNLKELVPGILYKDSECEVADTTEEGKDDVSEEITDLDNEIEKELAMSDETLDKDLKPPEIEIDESDVDIADSMKKIIEVFLKDLPKCVNRDLTDKAALDFLLNMNTKFNRRKLVRALFTVQRTRYDLLPFYSRLVATLHPCMPEVATELVALLSSDLKWHVRKKDQITIESKMKTVRFLGELVKFKMCSKNDALALFRVLLFNFNHHNIDMACGLLETCGRFLYRSRDSHNKTRVYLEVMMRKKAAQHLDVRYTTMIENAYYYSNPPEGKKEAVAERPPMHQYIRRLLYKDLSKVNVEKVLRQLRKLDWDDEEIEGYLTKCLIAIWNIRYNSIHCAANILAGLVSYHENIAIHVVDGVLEEIRWGMEVNLPKYNQRRVSTVKYLGELYNYRILESSVIFKTLYSFITFGITMDESTPSELDPPEHLFRLRLTCVLLDTCGQYFDRGNSKRKLDCFIVYLQRYYWFKRDLSAWSPKFPFPIGVTYMLRDTLEALRSKTKIYSSAEQTLEAVEKMETEIRKKIETVLPNYEKMSENADGGLGTIQEGEGEETDEFTGTQEDFSTQDSEGRSQGNARRWKNSESEDFLDSAGEIEDEDEVTLLQTAPKLIECQEDEDFMSALDKMVAETHKARHQQAGNVRRNINLSIPNSVTTQLAKENCDSKPVLMPAALLPEGDTAVQPDTEKKTDAVNYVLMKKSGDKQQQFVPFEVPATTDFAIRMKKNNQLAKEEKELLKNVVLKLHERQEQEELEEMLAAASRPLMPHCGQKAREKPVKYQHPKGAPDADAIFGNKRR